MSNNNSRHDYLCKRLRRTKADWQNPEQELLNHAADALEKLEADNAALRGIIKDCVTMMDRHTWLGRDRPKIDAARAAMREG